MSRFLKMFLITATISTITVCLFYWLANRSISRPSEKVNRTGKEIIHSHPSSGSSLLDSTGITLKDLGKISDNLRADEQAMYEARVTALRQILLVLGSSSHSASTLHDVFRVYREDLSDAQREVVDWFEAGGPSLERKWERSSAVSSLSHFQRQLSKNE